MANYIVYDIGGSSVKWSIMNNLGEIFIGGKIAISEELEDFFEELTNLVDKYKEEF